MSTTLTRLAAHAMEMAEQAEERCVRAFSAGNGPQARSWALEAKYCASATGCYCRIAERDGLSCLGSLTSAHERATQAAKRNATQTINAVGKRGEV